MNGLVQDVKKSLMLKLQKTSSMALQIYKNNKKLKKYNNKWKRKNGSSKMTTKFRKKVLLRDLSLRKQVKTKRILLKMVVPQKAERFLLISEESQQLQQNSYKNIKLAPLLLNIKNFQSLNQIKSGFFKNNLLSTYSPVNYQKTRIGFHYILPQKINQACFLLKDCLSVNKLIIKIIIIIVITSSKKCNLSSKLSENKPNYIYQIIATVILFQIIILSFQLIISLISFCMYLYNCIHFSLLFI
ncbi:transmembrane protein, putative (macronuclear) [Tetrahymena thermophila SB210]|uniref:Transmembrane protein, putative n=1 Tax=Tetrahymena thermophila (strain SB210) TaxID=312017 RepID=W7X6C5_TETTS|nr:transmembrane protein, putative [Tetrahymena thermophila SB210]EWS72957.1 transmembrane protein, putative [Tetrahymena thermophila SB210]|eukprot:XP_012654524.1 transmembrane protein, putative [Tetrahymena thermophila SB210]